MIHKIQLIELVTETLLEMGLYSDEARDLVLGTIAQESHFGKYIKQIKGPAKGIPTTLQGQAETWKRRYNTYKGAGTVDEYIKNFNRFVING